MMKTEENFILLKNEIKKYLATEKELQAAKEICTDWIHSKRKLEAIRNCDELFETLQYRGVFGPSKLNTLKLFQKLINEDVIYEMVAAHEKLVLSSQEPPQINKYALERQRQPRRQPQPSEPDPLPSVSQQPVPSNTIIPPERRIHVINLLKNQLNNRELPTFVRFLQINDSDFQDILRNHPKLSSQITAVLNCFFRKSGSSTRLLSALKQIKRNDLIKSLESLPGF